MKQSLRVVGLVMTAVAVAVPAFAIPTVPEIDPSIIPSGVMVLVGGVLALVEWRRRK
jgi:hypothetical protein